MTDKTRYQLALTFVKGIGTALTRSLIQHFGDEEIIFNTSVRELRAIPRISDQVIANLKDKAVMQRANEELTFIEKNGITPLFFTDDDYPQRLRHCVDAPIMLFAKGNVETNPPKVVSIVGTRQISEYGKDTCAQLVRELAERFPEVQIVSGLAYGVDIHAHRAALHENVSTVGVLAHGLDRIYPYAHRHSAIEMLQKGGLLTEYPSQTNPDPHNFVKRNRIVAGMSDAVVVVESAEKGGSLITAEIANSYFREVFAVPGRNSDAMSRGCNKLIAQNKAIILNNIDTLVEHLGWETTKKKAKPQQRELFVELSPDEEVIVNALRAGNDEGMQVNVLSVEVNISLPELFMLLLDMEMKQLVRQLPGGMVRLC